MTKKTFEQIGAVNKDTGAVAQRAYEIWQREGCPDGRAEEHWFRAESELAACEGISSPSEQNLKVRAPRRSPSRSGEKQFQLAGRS